MATAKIKTSKSDENTSTLKFILSYVSFCRLEQTLTRNLFLSASTEAKLASSPPSSSGRGDGGGINSRTGSIDKRQSGPTTLDLVRIDDIIIQTINEMAELPAVLEDPALQAALLARILVYRGRR